MQKTISKYLLVLLFGGILSATAISQTTTPENLSASFANVAKTVEPAVVSIDTKLPQRVQLEETPTDKESQDIMEFFRRQMPRMPSGSVGSGFIVDKSGYVLTNAHVIANAEKIIVRLDNGDELVATVIGTDDETDVAVLKVNAKGDLPFIVLGDSNKVNVGDWVLALGSPFGLNRTVTAGIISQTNRETPYASVFQKFLQTDAAINRGNSGGPLVNMNGEVIGLNSQIATTTGDYNGIGFALPAGEVKYVYDQIKQHGEVQRGFIGAVLESAKPEFGKIYGNEELKGAIILEIRGSDSPAGMAGLKVGDVITEFNGNKIAGAQDLISRVAAAEPGKPATVRFERESNGKLVGNTASITLKQRPTNSRVDSDRKKLPIDKTAVTKLPLDLSVVELSKPVAELYDLEPASGVVIKGIDPGSYVADVKLSNGLTALEPGSLIQRINHANITDLRSFNEAVGKLKAGDAVVMRVLDLNPASKTTILRIVQFTVQ